MGNATLVDDEFGKVKQLGFSIKLSDTPATVRSIGGLLGRDTDEVMAEAGYSATEIEALRAQGVVY